MTGSLAGDADRIKRPRLGAEREVNGRILAALDVPPPWGVVHVC
ncbi:hypothetical protein [Paenibacillus oralis]|nr:hypothetical protein [Paenibacillus oralis]